MVANLHLGRKKFDENSEDLEKEEDMAEDISLTVMRQDTWSWPARSWSWSKVHLGGNGDIEEAFEEN